MPLSGRRSTSSAALTLLAGLAVIAALRFAREVLIPFALAVLVSFLLAPLVSRLRRWHFKRVPAVLIVVLFAFTVVGVIGTLMTFQLIDLGGKLPEYQQNVHRKLESLRIGDGSPLARLSTEVQQVQKDLTPSHGNQPQTQGGGPSGNQQPVPVEIRGSEFSPISIVRTVLGSLLSIVASSFIVIIFVIFMLVEREDLRDRLIRLIGTGKINLTTQLLDDASGRVSRYLLMQALVNISYGIPIGLGLLLIGVPNPLLWGLLAALLRYIPYAGTWIAAIMPFAVAMAVDPGWTRPLMVLGLWLTVELIVANVVEPWIYGASGGITPLAVLAAAVFWAWVWGPVGLLLSTPLTVCLVAAGRYIPNFKFINVLLGDEPVLPPAVRFYQRLLARDATETAELARQFLCNRTLYDLFDTMISPALALAERDRARGELDDRHHRFILQRTRTLIEDLARVHAERVAKAEADNSDGRKPGSRQPLNVHGLTLCIPARVKTDEIAARMLMLLLGERGVTARIVLVAGLPSALSEAAGVFTVPCVSAMGMEGLKNARPVCRRLRMDFPAERIIVGFWNGNPRPEDLEEWLPAVPRENVLTTLKQAAERIITLLQSSDHPPPAPPRAALPEIQHAEH